MTADSPTKFINPLEEETQIDKIAEPCILVIFGATGDLTSRKLIPALYNLTRDGRLPAHFACVGFARRDKTNEMFREEMKEGISKFSRTQPLDNEVWESFSRQLFYHRSEFHDDAGYESLYHFLKELDVKFGTKGNRVYYLSTPPSYFPLITEKLSRHGLIYDESKERVKWSRVIIEKPFGHDLESAEKLQQDITSHLSENQIYRIDHWLGKETVQNILVFRFSNPIFESIWNKNYIDHFQITVAEEIGIGTRGKFFEEAGMLRDIVQNHLMQLLSLVCMEPPINLTADAIRDEKVKVIESIHPFPIKNYTDYIVRGQYGPGFINGEPVIGYREEKDVNPQSNVETFVAMELFIDNWRWAGVPFYLRAGKRLPKKTTEVAIVFKTVPGFMKEMTQNTSHPNVLVIRIQPNEGISLRINCKIPGLTSPLQPVKMDFQYGSFFGVSTPEAYERLICDCMAGDSTLFARVDEVFASWRLFNPIIERWKHDKHADFPNYASGTWGPHKSDNLLLRTGRKWRLI